MTGEKPDTKALRALLEKATPGPWHWEGHDEGTITSEAAGHAGKSIVESDNRVYGPSDADGELIVAMRSALPALLDAADRLAEVEAELARQQTVYLKGCECSPDDACLFARERDAVRERLAEVERERDALRWKLDKCTTARLDRSIELEHAEVALAAAEAKLAEVEAALSAEYTRIELAEHLTKVANEKAEAVERSSLVRRTPVSDARSDLLGLALAGDCCEGSDTTRTDAWKAARNRLSEAERVAGLEKTK